MSDSNAMNATTAYYGYCQYRLPCGYCKEMKSMCPYAGSGGFKITCATSGTTCGSGSANSKTMEVSFGGDNNAIHVINKAENVTL